MAYNGLDFRRRRASSFGGSLLAYAANSITPQLVADFKGGVYGKNSGLSTFGDVLNHARSSAATYVDSAGLLQTAASGVARENHHVYNGSAWVKEGYLHEPETAIQLLLSSGTLSTQNVTVTAEPHTLQFTGTGTVTLSGTSTDGPLVGTGTGENNRVNLTFTPSAGTLTLTVSGTVTNAQFEAGSVPTSYMPTDAVSTFTRAADTLTLPVANIPYPEPVVIGPELVTNGDFSNGTTGWFSARANSTLSVVSGELQVQADSSGAFGAATTLSGLSIGENYQVVYSCDPQTSPRVDIRVASNSAFTSGIVAADTVSEEVIGKTLWFVATATVMYFGGIESGSITYNYALSEVSAAQINPPAVSFGYKALVTGQNSGFVNWTADANNGILMQSGTNDFTFTQEAGGTVDSLTGGSYTSGINVPVSIAMRNGLTFINGADDGTALTANTTPTAFPDLSTTDLIIAPSGGPQIIREFIFWGGTTGNIGDTGMDETST